MEGTAFETSVTIIKGDKPGPAMFIVADFMAMKWRRGVPEILLRMLLSMLEHFTLFLRLTQTELKTTHVMLREALTLTASFQVMKMGIPHQGSLVQFLQKLRKLILIFYLTCMRLKRSEMTGIFLEVLSYLQSLKIWRMFSLSFYSLPRTARYVPSRLTTFLRDLSSINYAVTTELNIPVITVETFRGYLLEQRIADHLDIIQYTMRLYGMI